MSRFFHGNPVRHRRRLLPSVAILFAALAFMAAPRSLLAQATCTLNGNTSCSLSVGADITVPHVSRLTLSTTSTSISPNLTDFNQGYVIASPPSTPTLSVRSNSPWAIDVSTLTMVWNATAGGWADKPSTELHVGTTAASFPLSLTTTGQALVSGQGATSSGSVASHYKVLLQWANDSPADYTITVRYTFSAP